MISVYSVNMKFLICLFKGHDKEEIPKPTNKDYGTTSPGTACVRCGELTLKKDVEQEPTRTAKAKAFYEKHAKHEHFTNSPSGVICPSPHGPYSPYPPPSIPDDD